MDSDTYRRPAADTGRRAEGERHRLPDTRYPNHARFAPDVADNDDVYGHYRSGEGSSGRLRAAMLIVIAVVALSAVAAIGWLQYQSGVEDRDPHYEIMEPDRSVPAEAGASGG